MANFSDYFSKQSDIYVKYRPTYPKELFSYLSSLTKEHKLAWDGGTGNGQSANGLSEFYDSIIATDPSEEQIKNAIPYKKIVYRVEKAEDNSLQTASADIITIANAMHWFNFDAFYKEVRRVLKPNGIIAAWAYGLPIISPEIDPIVKRFHDETLGTYWLEPNRMVEKGYTTIPFPFEFFSTPKFRIEKLMNLADFIGYFNTWSATQRYISQHNINPTEELEKDLRKVWGDAELEKKLTWDLILKIGKVNG